MRDAILLAARLRPVLDRLDRILEVLESGAIPARAARGGSREAVAEAVAGLAGLLGDDD